jgi:diaminopimelate epimerase
MRITKMHGLENDFLVVDEPFPYEPSLVAAMCDRRAGIGADGLLAVGPTEDGASMRYWNADGSQAEMCGNGLRCVARYAVDLGITTDLQFTVATPVGPRRVTVGGDTVEVELGPVALESTVEIEGHSYRRVSVGNPHAVRMVDDPASVDVAAVGAQVERDPLFPDGTNVEFVAQESNGSIRLRVWERGVGETMACGTGMAAAARAVSGGTDGRPIEVSVPGGTGWVRFVDSVAWLRGPAVTVFTTDVDPVAFSGPS